MPAASAGRFVIVAAYVAACSSAAPSVPPVQTSASVQTSAPLSSRASRPTCPVVDSGTCLGTLRAGTYSSSTFEPPITFTVPAGWSNYLDIAGLFLLMPPGASPPGDTITTDFIGVETSVVAQGAAAAGAPCSLQAAPGVGTDPAAIAAWLSEQPGLSVSNRHPAMLGGLTGIALDVEMTAGWMKGCTSAGLDGLVVPLVVGVDASDFDHEVAKGYAERDFLLSYRGRTLLVNLVDGSGGANLETYTALTTTFRFAP